MASMLPSSAHSHTHMYAAPEGFKKGEGGKAAEVIDSTGLALAVNRVVDGVIDASQWKVRRGGTVVGMCSSGEVCFREALHVVVDHALSVDVRVLSTPRCMSSSRRTDALV